MMKTKFSDITREETPHADWSGFFHAGTSWLRLHEFLKEPSLYIGDFMCIDPHVAGLCLELNAKALAAYTDHSFQPKKFNHKTSKLLKAYSEIIPVFKTIVENKDDMELIKEYEKTIDSRYGSLGGNIPGTEQQRIIELAFTVRDEMCRLTKLR